VLRSDHPHLDAELAPLGINLGLFSSLTATAAACFYAEIKERRSSSGTSEPEQGTWSSSSSTLALSFGDGTQISFEYVIEGVTLFCPRESRYRLWQRVG
jgi:hypothetical protein